MFYNENFYCCVPTQIPYLSKILFLRDIGQTGLPQTDCRIFNSTTSPEQMDETASFFVCLYKFSKIKCWLKFFWLGMVKSGCGQYGLITLKLTLSQELIDRINWYFASWYKFRKSKSWFNDIWVGMVKNGHGFLVYETQESAVNLE